MKKTRRTVVKILFGFFGVTKESFYEGWWHNSSGWTYKRLLR